MSTAYGPRHARGVYQPQTYRGRHSRPDPDPRAGSPLPWLVVGGSLLLTALILVITVWSQFLSTEFDQWAVQHGVARVLTDNGYTVGPVSCPPGQPVEVGHRFSCQASLEGDWRDVDITVRTQGGEYEVGAPR